MPKREGRTPQWIWLLNIILGLVVVVFGIAIVSAWVEPFIFVMWHILPWLLWGFWVQGWMVFASLNFLLLAILALCNGFDKSIPHSPRIAVLVVGGILVNLNAINFVMARLVAYVLMSYWLMVVRIDVLVLLTLFLVFAIWHRALSRGERWLYIAAGLFFIVPVEGLLLGQEILWRMGTHPILLHFLWGVGFNIPSWITVGYGILSVILGLAAAHK